ncbi:S-type pyocin domain-containing protein [Sodalis sp. RH21]|uniref:S-type pyocin domain-containing protein n=1 Tax=unclassified Sodalis (in: enterobacteria) TaxID=2636512 RepID=UPI0039B3EA2B
MFINTPSNDKITFHDANKRWNDLRNIELNNKNIIISRSKIELDKIKHHISIINQGITYSNKKLPEVNSPANHLGFLSATQQSLMEKGISACDTADCEVGANVKPVAAQGVTLSSQALAIAGTATLAPAAGLIKGSTALAELNRIAFLSVGPMALAGATLFYSKPVGVGSDRVPGGKDFRQTLQIGDLDLTSADIFGLYAQGEALARSNTRGRLANINGAMHVELYKTEMPTEIRLLEGIPVGKGVFKCTVPTTDDYPARTILVTPDRVPGAEGLGGLATPSSGPKAIADTGNQSQPVQLPTVTTYPDLSETDFNDLIVVPPLDGGYKPVYVPGTVTGQGQKVGANWLADAATEQGAPIPEQIADKLRDKRFNSFGAFRKAFWLEIGKNPDLVSQFSEFNVDAIERGAAPLSIKAEQVGKRRKFELHHIEQIGKSGEVYNVDNLNILTPKRHIETHSNNGQP